MKINRDSDKQPTVEIEILLKYLFNPSFHKFLSLHSFLDFLNYISRTGNQMKFFLISERRFFFENLSYIVVAFLCLKFYDDFGFLSQLPFLAKTLRCHVSLFINTNGRNGAWASWPIVPFLDMSRHSKPRLGWQNKQWEWGRPVGPLESQGLQESRTYALGESQGKMKIVGQCLRGAAHVLLPNDEKGSSVQSSISINSLTS